MADVKPTETAPVAEPVVETKPAEETPAVAPAATEEVAAPAPVVAAETTEAAPAVAAAEAVEAPAATEEAKKEVEEAKPVDEGHLSHKGEGANFPKNLIHSKKLFWFGSEPVDVKAAPSFKSDKIADVAHHVTAWAAETGKGLLFFGEKDKSAPQGAIQLAEASEPATEGTNKFHFVSKGHKHSFKAGSAAERDAWVAQLKTKIAEAKELAATVTESETYKKTLEALKPAKKEEKAPAVAAAEPAAEATEAEAPAAAPAAEAVAEAPKEEEAKKDELVVEEPKRRSASRKRASIFGSFLSKKEEKKTEAAAAAEPEAPAAEASTAAPTEAAAAEAAADPVAAAAEVPAAAETPAETKPEEKKEEAAAEPVKPAPTKRQSLFGALSFGKKKVTSPEPTPTTEEPPVVSEPVSETAPVIPAVETTEPLSAEVSSPATVPTETTEVAPATNGETPKEEVKKEIKSDKRKSSLPFVGAFLSPKEKTEKPHSDDEGDKPKSPSRSPFSKFRDTIKGKKAVKETKAEEKAEDKPEETPAPVAETEAAAATEEAPKPAETEAAAIAPVVEEPAKPAAATPVVTAAA